MEATITTTPLNATQRHVLQTFETARNEQEKEELTSLYLDCIRHKRETGKSEISKFKVALQETKTISLDIAQNGVIGYKTLDDLLNEE